MTSYFAKEFDGLESDMRTAGSFGTIRRSTIGPNGVEYFGTSSCEQNAKINLLNGSYSQNYFVNWKRKKKDHYLTCPQCFCDIFSWRILIN
jgi:hypothetical protein